MLKLKLLVVCVLMKSSVFAWSQPTQQAPTPAPAATPAQPALSTNLTRLIAKPNASLQPASESTASSYVSGLICTIFASHFDLFSLSFVLSAYSTYKVEPTCNEDFYYDLTLASITAQSRIVTGSTTTFRGGIHAYLMDVNLSTVSNPFFSIGNLKFSKIGDVRIGLINIFKKKSWHVGSVVDMTYNPFVLESKIHYIWNVGSLIHRLVAPNGDFYVMYAYTNEVAPELKRETLIDLGGQLRLPAGWRYENELLNKTITVRSTPYNAFGSEVLFDELNNFYVKYTR